MKKYLSNYILCSLLGLLFLGFQARAQIAVLPISGPNGACVNQVTTYSVPTAPGITFVWSATSGTVIGSSSGSVVNIKWSGTPGSGSVTVNGYHPVNGLVSSGTLSPVTISAVPQPQITTNYRVACLAPGDDSMNNGQQADPMPPPVQNEDLVLDDINGCIRVCSGAAVTYYAQGQAGSAFTWSASNGTVLVPKGSSTTIVWGAPGFGSVTVYENKNGCIGSRTICVQIIDKPLASFSLLPSNKPLKPGATVEVCINSSVGFKDLSTAPNSYIRSWYWDYGDGTSSSQSIPTPHTYTSTGIFPARLIVTNGCGCTDTFEVTIRVLPRQGPPIFCGASSCENDSATYYTTASCVSYNWGVNGGTIISNYGSSITVLWDQVDATGFGYVSLSGACANMCPGTTTIKVPVIQQNPEIKGATLLCVDQRMEYSMPLWPGTHYEWGVINDPGSVVGTRNSNNFIVKFANPGNYQVHVAWKNAFSICGGDTIIDVTVVPGAQITGPDKVCKNGGSIQYDINPPDPSTMWSVTDPKGHTSVSFGPNVNVTFSLAGVYTITASGNFCSNPFSVQVSELAHGVDSVTGKRTVCLNTPYTYAAYDAEPGTIFVYEALNGNLTLGTGNTATVVWTSLPGILLVKRQSTSFPFCESEPVSIDIYEDLVNPVVTGPDTVCSNTYNNFSCNYYSEGAGYTWKIIEDTLGSVQTGTYDPDIVFLSDHFTAYRPGWIKVTVQQCNLTVSDSMRVTVVPAARPYISAPDSACSGDTLTFTAVPGAEDYWWLFGDQSNETTINTVRHVYYNPTPNRVTIRVEVEATGSDGTTICPPAGKEYKLIVIKPGPKVTIRAMDTTVWCSGQTVLTRLRSTVSNMTGTPQYQWYYKPRTGLSPATPITGATSSQYNATGDGHYFVLVTNPATGCKGRSNGIDVIVNDCSGTSCTGTLTFSGSPVPNCGSITLTGTPVSANYTNPIWYAPFAVSANPSGNTISLTYDRAGRHLVNYAMDVKQANGTWCKKDYTGQAIVPMMPNVKTDVKCGTNKFDIYLIDISSFLDEWPTRSDTDNVTTSVYNIYNTSWVFETTVNGDTVLLPTLTPGMHNVIQTTILRDRFGNPIAGPCTDTSQIFIPSWATVTIGGTPTPTCEGLPVTFTSTITPTAAEPFVARWMWSFGDSARSALDDTYRVYTNNTLTDPKVFITNLEMWDTWGCRHDATPFNVTVYDNKLAGNVTGGQEVCSGPVLLTYNNTSGTPASYMWSNSTVFNGASTLSVKESGAYHVTVEDARKCRFVTKPDQNVIIHDVPTIAIDGEKDYCVGEIVTLSGYAGPEVQHNWYRNGTHVATGPSMYDAGRPVGSYNYTLVLKYSYNGVDTCTTTVGPFAVTVHGIPNPPNISGPTLINCSTYELQLFGSHSSGASTSFNWSNGAYGQTNNINEGGLYRLWFTDQWGCISHRDTTVPESPEHYFGFFPSSCYAICPNQLPLDIYGPPGLWGAWEWNNGAGTPPIDNGINSTVNPLTINSPGTYHLSLDNGICSQLSEPLDIIMTACSCPQAVGPYQFFCDPSVPNRYTLNVMLMNPTPNPVQFTIGLTNGPAVPFHVTIPPGAHPVNITVNLMTPPPIYIEVSWTMNPGGKKCYERIPVDPSSYPYPCGWPQQFSMPTSTGGQATMDKQAAQQPVLHNSIEKVEVNTTGMIVYPNPADHMLKVSYRYADRDGSGRNIVVYDMLGRRVLSQPVNEVSGVQELPSATWSPGVYIIQMEENGKALHTQRATVTH